ncbi:tetratricopeptide repeat protein [Zestomonas carbonaria]|uniref:Sel1 repeat family protein n=2 Tax=Zestomonas carbonaria TaxID=2762745 RepID=A0A7U7IAU2_9GAMM|nr:tetratricopeptide repeat protein [Pseudomonas carbonaria]CAD5109794.1 hypothetical protein PSEWESI4_04108 [Pseudomonas carbonaria]
MVGYGLSFKITRWVLIILLATLSACVQEKGEKDMDIHSIDWKSLQFTCTQEQNPPLDPEADIWFQQARAYEKQDNEANDAEMVRLYQQASERGHYKAMLNLAGLYVHGTGVPRNEGKALDLVEKAMQLKAPHAYYLMGVMLQQGIGVKQDKVAALSYFRKSADLGNRYGQWAIGDELRRAFARLPEPERTRGKNIGKQMLECALAQDLAEAGHALGMEYLIGKPGEQDTHTALLYFQKAAALGHKASLYRIYSMFEAGENGLNKDPGLAACYYKLLEQVRTDPSKRFPDIDTLCPLPPVPARAADSSQSEG